MKFLLKLLKVFIFGLAAVPMHAPATYYVYRYRKALYRTVMWRALLVEPIYYCGYVLSVFACSVSAGLLLLGWDVKLSYSIVGLGLVIGLTGFGTMVQAAFIPKDELQSRALPEEV